jgi:hypothetical protein
MPNEMITFAEYKQTDSGLCIELEVPNGSESDFSQWLTSQKRFFDRRGINSDDVSLSSTQLKWKHWDFLLIQYERMKQCEAYASDYPEGFFEAVNVDNNQDLVCFLPEPSHRMIAKGYPYRLAYYDQHGPRYHECYQTREEALIHIGRAGYKATSGQLEKLSITDDWKRGFWIQKWRDESIYPLDGIRQNRHVPEVFALFAKEISELN